MSLPELTAAVVPPTLDRTIVEQSAGSEVRRGACIHVEGDRPAERDINCLSARPQLNRKKLAPHRPAVAPVAMSDLVAEAEGAVRVRPPALEAPVVEDGARVVRPRCNLDDRRRARVDHDGRIGHHDRLRRGVGRTGLALDGRRRLGVERRAARGDTDNRDPRQPPTSSSVHYPEHSRAKTSAFMGDAHLPPMHARSPPLQSPRFTLARVVPACRRRRRHLKNYQDAHKESMEIKLGEQTLDEMCLVVTRRTAWSTERPPLTPTA